MGQDSAGFFRLQICDMTSQMGSMGKLSNNPWTHIFLHHYSKWWFPKIGLPPVIIHFRWFFHDKPSIGDPLGLWKAKGPGRAVWCPRSWTNQLGKWCRSCSHWSPWSPGREMFCKMLGFFVQTYKYSLDIFGLFCRILAVKMRFTTEKK